MFFAQASRSVSEDRPVRIGRSLGAILGLDVDPEPLYRSALRGIGRAIASGTLDAGQIGGMPTDEALRRWTSRSLKSMKGDSVEQSSSQRLGFWTAKS